jgi:iron complex transport system substrate-binding protein
MFRLTIAALLLSTTAAFAHPVTVQSCNRQVTFEAPPAKAISNDVNLTEMMLVLGLRDRMVGYTGISGWKTLDEEMRAGVAELPELSAKYPTKEVLAAAEPDFFFAGWNYGMKVGGEVTPETLEPLGMKVYELTESCIHIGPKAKSSMDDMYADILNLGTIFGVSAKAEELVAGWKARLAEVTAKVDRTTPLRVFVYDSGEKAPFTAGAYAMPTAMIEAAGGKKSWMIWKKAGRKSPGSRWSNATRKWSSSSIMAM